MRNMRAVGRARKTVEMGNAADEKCGNIPHFSTAPTTSPLSTPRRRFWSVFVEALLAQDGLSRIPRLGEGGVRRTGDAHGMERRAGAGIWQDKPARTERIDALRTTSLETDKYRAWVQWFEDSDPVDIKEVRASASN